MASIVDSLVAPLSVINALIVALCMKNRKKVAKTLEMLEDIWDEYQVYERVMRLIILMTPLKCDMEK